MNTLPASPESRESQETHTADALPALRSSERSNYAVQVIPSRHGHGQAGLGVVQLTAAMHSLVLSAQHPLALELVGTAAQRSFLLRATTQAGLEHAITQLRARYPQAQFRVVLSAR